MATALLLGLALASAVAQTAHATEPQNVPQLAARAAVGVQQDLLTLSDEGGRRGPKRRVPVEAGKAIVGVTVSACVRPH